MRLLTKTNDTGLLRWRMFRVHGADNGVAGALASRELSSAEEAGRIGNWDGDQMVAFDRNNKPAFLYEFGAGNWNYVRPEVLS